MSDENVVQAPAVSVRLELQLVKERLTEAERLYNAHSTFAVELMNKHNKLVGDTARIINILTQSNTEQLRVLKELTERIQCVEEKLAGAGL